MPQEIGRWSPPTLESEFAMQARVNHERGWIGLRADGHADHDSKVELMNWATMVMFASTATGTKGSLYWNNR
jgi:hypothetical protein